MKDDERQWKKMKDNKRQWKTMVRETEIETETMIAISDFSDTVDFSWQIEKLESWHYGLVIDSQRVTWTAFAILAMFER